MAEKRVFGDDNLYGKARVLTQTIRWGNKFTERLPVACLLLEN